MIARAVLFAAVCAFGCRGEAVEPATTSDTAVAESGIIESGASDAADTAVSESGDASGSLCNPPGNLVTNGDFSAGVTGWVTDNVKLELVDGPCGGKGVRVFDVISYGSTSVTVSTKIPKDTKLHLRGFFKASGTSAGRTPSLFARGIHYDDAGVEGLSELGQAYSELGPSWKMVDATFVLTRDEDRIVIGAASREPTAWEFALGGVSLVIE